MTPRDPEVLASRWRLDELLAGTRQVEVHSATDIDLGSEVVAVLWSDDPGPSGREVAIEEVDLVDFGEHDGVSFATYARLDGVPMAAATKAALARAFVPGDDATAPVAVPSAAPEAPRRGGLVAAGVAGLLLLVAAGGLVLGWSGDDEGGRRGSGPPVAEAIEEPLRGALRELREAAGEEGLPDVVAVEEAVTQQDRPAAERALDRLRRRDRGGSGGRPGRLALAVDRVRAALPPQRGVVDGAAAVSAPCEPTTTTTTPQTTTTTDGPAATTTTSSTVAPDADATTTTTVPCEPATAAGQPTTTTTAGGASPTSSTSSTTTTPGASSTSTTTTTTQASTTSSSTTSTTTSTTTTTRRDAARR